MEMVREINRLYELLTIVCALLVQAIMFTACQDELSDDSAINTVEADGLTVTCSVLIPEMPDIRSRGIIGETSQGGLKLTIFEFDKGTDAQHSFLSNIYKADITSASTAVEDGVPVSFKFTLKAATTPKVLHLFISNEYLTSDFGSVATILPSLTVGELGSEYEAYWGYVEFEHGFTDIIEEDGIPQLLPEVTNKLTKVPVIRNFAKISVRENLNNFELLGFDVVNVPTSGTIAPWNQTTQSIPSLIDGSSMRSYKYITNTLKYNGIVPGNSQFRNTESDAKQWTSTSQNMLSSTPRYIYEHPYESTRRTYLIVYGKYTDPYKVETYGFYKLDIGVRNPENGTFDYYNIIRNIHYIVNITEVLAPGTATVEEAIARAPFNNLIGATETSSMLNVSNGKNLLIVNDTNHIIVDNNQTIEILYRYITDITGDRKVENGIPHTTGLETGDVIKKIIGPVTYTDGNDVSWMRIQLEINNPTNTVKTQSFAIVDGAGLGRTINLILRRPWQYAYIGDTNYTATIAPNTNNLYTTPVPQNISSQAQEPATVYFNLRDGLPDSMFPLDFTLEAEKQALENHKSDNLVVSSGPSLFDPNITAIQYIKTVTYQEYMHPYKNDGSNDVNTSVINTNHTIRCRFLTTVAVTPGTEGEVKIHNEYFSPDASVKFKRQ